ncbi:hypothetical protein [Aquimarina sp. Aq107]|uniref:hypothetical protein n=1 Tax=Aquimarina sp. Aq107 TaxID=1191912 RepID=UPI000D55D3D2|nr:hypothetical protein [Aquimarina sp. Aq107]
MVGFKRQVTHTAYQTNNLNKKYYKGLTKNIGVKPRGIKKEWVSKNGNYLYLSNEYVQIKTGANAIPLVGSIICIFVLLLFSYVWYFKGSLGIMGISLFSISIISLIFFIVYYLTMPKKEHILNRLDGLITFTGTFWQKNITMTFQDVEFNYTTGNEDGTGAFILQVVRPNKIRSFDIFSFGGTNCYEDLAMITWYMDKNRPLPPGDAFDEFREQDYERRKAEGFPKPQYPSIIKTPEATKKQQEEREKIGGW